MSGLSSAEGWPVAPSVTHLLDIYAILMPAGLDSYAFNRKQKYFNKSQAASSSWMMLLMDASALWYAASSLLLGRASLLGWW